MTQVFIAPSGREMPGWVPVGAVHYLAHTEQGQSIRELARIAGCHASTISRQVRRIESRRDDPLIDAALRGLSVWKASVRAVGAMKDEQTMSQAQNMPEADVLAREGCRILRRLCEAGAVLAVSTSMEKAIVVRNDIGGQGTRTATVDRVIAEVMALKNWIACVSAGKVARYRITQDGRSALARFLAEDENRAGAIDAPSPEPGQSSRPRAQRSDPPLLALARRREKDGSLFLAPDLVAAGERLREDFELAQMSPNTTQNWDSILTGRIDGTSPSSGPGGVSAAQGRLQAALADLGAGLGDVALMCCCFLEGLETAEKKMGWSARSGKIVLRIALQRLKRHYDESGQSNVMIG